MALLMSTPVLSVRGREVLSDVAMVPIAALVLLCSLRTARRADRRLRRPWLLLALAGLLWTAGEAAWYVKHYVVMVERVPSAADMFYLAAVVPAAVSLVLFPPPSRGARGGVTSLLSCLVAAGSVLFVARILIVRVAAPADGGSTAADIFYTAYPVADVVLLTLALVALIRSGNLARPHLRLVAAGLATYAVADTVYSIQSSLGIYMAGSPVDLGWVAGYLLIALAALHPSAGPDQPATAGIRHGGLASLLVYLRVMVAAVVAATLPGSPDAVLIVIGIGLVIVFALRQGLLAADHAKLNAQREDQLAAIRQSEALLRRQVLQTQRITSSVADGILVVDPDRRVVMTNGPASSILRRSATQLQGQLLDDLLVDHDAAVLDSAARARSNAQGAAVIAAVTGGTVLSAVDTLFRSADGTVPVEVTVGPMLEQGRSAGTVLVLRDVSARRAVEKLKNEFISVVSHELRTPLTSIRGSLALLDGGACGVLEPSGSRMVTLALQASERLTRLIDDLLDIERLESGALTMEYQECDAARLVDAALREMRGLAQQHDVELVRSETAGRVLADPDRIVQTLTNLISNAVKFSPAGSRVTLGAAPVGARGGADVRAPLVEFSVADEGRGIPPENLEAVFERFEQVDSSDSRQRGGTGLGLAICRNIVERHGGRIWATSEVDRGSDFRFVLPAVAADPPVPAGAPPVRRAVALSTD